MKSGNASKELYKQLRVLPWPQLWAEEVPRFDRGTSRERFEQVSVIRAVGVVFSESGPAEQRDEVQQWLLRLLHDPEEKIRRYAMAGLSKVGVGATEEAELLELRRTTTSAREQKFLGQTLDLVGAGATLDVLEGSVDVSPLTMLRVKANVARVETPSSIRMDRELTDFAGLRIHLRGRRGLERIVREEVEESGRFRVVGVKPGLVAVTPRARITLADIFSLRCFGTVGFVLGLVKSAGDAVPTEALAGAISSPLAQRLFETLTEGAIRYRLEFITKGQQSVRDVADRVFALCPRILNDPRQAPWAVDIHSTAHGESVELRPRFSPDPRQAWRLDDVPAASHPPLAACLARMAGHMQDENVWDPFCGSGLELIESARRGGTRRVFGTDRCATALGIAQRNFTAAQLGPVETHFAHCDFRHFATVEGLSPGSVTLIITNPPLGRRIRIPNLRGLFEDLFAVAAEVLQPGGRLVFINPFRMESPQPSLQLQSRQAVDLGGFKCQLEVYRKA